LSRRDGRDGYAPKIVGASGGGIWRLDPEPGGAGKLAGIIIEPVPLGGHLNTVAATRLPFILNRLDSARRRPLSTG
jgi:hypothetical protein